VGWLGGIAPTTFWPWGQLPPSPPSAPMDSDVQNCQRMMLYSFSSQIKKYIHICHTEKFTEGHTVHIYGNKEVRCCNKERSSHKNDLQSPLATVSVSNIDLQQFDTHWSQGQNQWNLSMWSAFSTTAAAGHVGTLASSYARSPASSSFSRIVLSIQSMLLFDINNSQGSVATCLR